MSQKPDTRRSRVLVPAAGGVFLAFMLGLTLGTTGKPPAPLLSEAVGGMTDIASYSRDAFLARPSQHLRPRVHPGNGVTVSLPDEMQPGVTLVSGLFGQILGFRLYANDGTLLKQWPIDFFKLAPDEMKHRYHALIHGEFLYPNGDIVANLDGRGIVRKGADFGTGEPGISIGTVSDLACQLDSKNVPPVRLAVINLVALVSLLVIGLEEATGDSSVEIIAEIVSWAFGE